jgi:arsenite methyltransferase
VPLDEEPLRLLERAGFQGMHLVKFAAKPCFVRDDIGMREMQLVGWKGSVPANGKLVTVLYKGPYRQVTDDSGAVYTRGERTQVEAARAELLRQGSLAEQFVFFPSGE